MALERSAASGDGMLGNEICMIFDGETGNALGCFDYTPEALEEQALEIRRARGEVTTVTYGPSPFVTGTGGQGNGKP